MNKVPNPTPGRLSMDELGKKVNECKDLIRSRNKWENKILDSDEVYDTIQIHYELYMDEYFKRMKRNIKFNSDRIKKLKRRKK